jgi:hypothetical protein
MSSSKWAVPSKGALNGEGRLKEKIIAVYYLQRRGFLPSEVDLQSLNLSPALKDFQQSGGLPKTGYFDEATSKLMGTPCCGYTNRGGPLAFAKPGSRWDHQGSHLARRDVHSQWGGWAGGQVQRANSINVTRPDG